MPTQGRSALSDARYIYNLVLTVFDLASSQIQRFPDRGARSVIVRFLQTGRAWLRNTPMLLIKNLTIMQDHISLLGEGETHVTATQEGVARAFAALLRARLDGVVARRGIPYVFL